MANTIVWADIPVADMDRARKFYAAVLEAEVPLMDGANGDVALFRRNVARIVNEAEPLVEECAALALELDGRA